MLLEALSAARDLGRLHELASILIRYGFGDAVRRLGLAGALEQAGKALRWNQARELARLEPPQRVRKAMEEMGPTFVKLGQILATRIDLFGPEWISEFEKLQDQAPPLPFDQIQADLEESLGMSVDDAFAKFDREAQAAASIAQVHNAQLLSGENVIVKVRRPGIRHMVDADLRLLIRLAEIAESEIPELRRYQPVQVVRKFGQSLRRELDLASECQNAERIATNLEDYADVVIPKVYWNYTSERLNVQERIEGFAGRDLAAIDEAGLNRKELAKTGADAVLQMLLVDGFFHADPHPGNVFYLADNRIALIDFGMVGYLSESRRHQVIDLLHGLVEHEAGTVVDVLLDWAGPVKIDQDAVQNDIEAFITRFHSVALGELDLGSMLGDLIVLMREHDLTLPADLALMFKVFVTLEGLGRQLDPDFDMAAEAKPFLREALIARYKPQALARRGWKSVSTAIEVMGSLPQDLRRLLKAARYGALQINIDMNRLEQFGHQIDRAASRMTIGLVTAALIIGSSIVSTVDTSTKLFGLPVLGALGFTGAGLGAVWLVISIWRGGKS